MRQCIWYNFFFFFSVPTIHSLCPLPIQVVQGLVKKQFYFGKRIQVLGRWWLRTINLGLLWLAKGKDGAVTQLFLWHTTVWWQQKCTRYWTVQTFKRNIRWIDNLIAVVAQNKTVEVKCRYLCFYYIPFIISKWLFFILSKNIMGLHCRNFCSAVTFCIFSFYPSDLENLTKKGRESKHLL